MKWNDYLNIYSKNLRIFVANNQPLDVRKCDLLSTFLLYSSHANSILLFGRTSFNEYAHIDEAGQINIFSTEPIDFDLSVQNLLCLDTITQFCANQCKNVSTNDNTIFDATEACEFMEKFIRARAGKTLDVREFTQDCTLKIIQEFSYNAGVKSVPGM